MGTGTCSGANLFIFLENKGGDTALPEDIPGS